MRNFALNFQASRLNDKHFVHNRRTKYLGKWVSLYCTIGYKLFFFLTVMDDVNFEFNDYNIIV